MSGVARAAAILDRLHASGCRELVVCGGSRNAPLVAAAAARERMRSWNFFEERSAAFFALGRIRASSRPVAVITTSGTAAAELLPAAVEAHYSGLPLILVTADRPARHRGTGAPQAIEQRDLFGPYAAFVEIDDGDAALPAWRRDGPLHVNVPFDEPLLDGRVPPAAEAAAIPTGELPLLDPGRSATRIDTFIRESSRLLVIAGALEPAERIAVRDLARRIGAPLLAEPLSGLREDPALAHLVLRAGERSLDAETLDGVLRIGGIPTARFWRDLDERLRVPVLSCSRLPFSGLPRGEHLRCDLADTLSRVDAPQRENAALLTRDAALAQRMDAVLESEPASEPALFRALSRAIPAGSLVFLGNSLPIREWDLFARYDRPFVYGASRGATGIDGQVSSFLGMAEPERENWCVVGDLTALYDLAALWVAPQLDPALSVRIVVVNNGGGRIFGRVPSLRAVDAASRERLFENPHEIGFEPWARMWGFDYVPTLRERIASTRTVIEIRPDAASSERVWKALDEISA